MDSVTSRDGTLIAYERSGVGPAVILVGGGLDDGTENAPLVPLLSHRFTVVNYARRGRGESGDTQPYAVEREIEDLQALIEVAGGSAHLYGVSSGGALALEAAAAEVGAELRASRERLSSPPASVHASLKRRIGSWRSIPLPTRSRPRFPTRSG
jgi:alpha-beta hydrolase superfamily lysophospholipase